MNLETPKPPCCAKPSDEVVQIGIGDDTIGLIALNQIFEQLRVLGRPPDRSVEDELLLMVGARNYIPRSCEDEYRDALLREYRKYCEKKEKAKK